MKPLDQALGFEVGDDVLDGVNHVAHERVNAKVVADSGPGQYYVREEPLHLHFRWFLGDRPVDGKEICARFHWLFDDVEGHFHGLASGDGRHARPVVQDENGAMFIDVVEFMEVPERVGGRLGLVSLVWLRELHCCECGRANDGLEEVQRSGERVSKVVAIPRLADSPVAVELIRAIEDREVQVPLLLLRQRAALCGDGEDQMVECRPQLVKDLAEHQSPFKLWFTEVMGCDDYALPVSVVMEPKRLRGVFRAVTAKTTVLEIIEVFLGPFHFKPKNIGY